MSAGLVVLLALLTYGSRAAGLLLLPRPSPRLQHFLNRLPGPLFAGLAALSLVDEGGALAPAPLLGGVLGALLLAPTRSLPLVLLGGLLGWGGTSWLLLLLSR